MYQSQPVGFAATDDTWILVANRKGARILASDGGVKNLRLVQEMAQQEGLGLVDRKEAVYHVMQGFVRDVARLLKKARAENAYSRLVLVAEPRFLGELRSMLDARTTDRIAREIDRDLYDYDLPKLKEWIAGHWLSG